MANTTIPNLPAGTSLSGNEQLEAVQSGTSVRVTAAQIAALAQNTQGTVTQINTGGALIGGPITTTGTISLPPDAVTNEYLAEMPANTLKANITNLTANPTDVTPSQLFDDAFGAAEGSMVYRGASTWQVLAPGVNNQYLYTTGNLPQWVTLAIDPGDIGPSGVTPGSYGNAASAITFTVNSGGLLTAAAAIPIAITNTQVSGLGTMSVQNANNVSITGGSLDGTVIGASTPAQAYFTTISGGTWQGTAIAVANGGTGATNATDARTNLGLGTMATQNASNVAISGGNINGTVIGNSSAQAGTFTNLTASGTVSLGTITAGTWNGNAIAVAHGGTGATDATTARANLSAAKSGANSDITSLTGLTTPLSATQGGTGFSSYTTGDILYSTASNALGRLNDVATGNVLLSGGVGVAPAYGKVGLTTHVDGILPVANGGTGAATLTGYVKGNGTSVMTASATIPNGDLDNSSLTIGSTSISLGGSSATLAGLTSVTLTQDPSAALQASTKQYVDNQVAIVSNVTYHTQVTAASTANLNANYNNGTGGVGATLTNAGALAQFQIDLYTPGSLARVLIKDQSSPAQNGIYEVTTQGDAISVPWVLTRTSDFNAPGAGPNFIQTGASVFVQNGDTQGSTSWVMTTTGTISVGTTALNWTQSSASGNILVTAPLSKSGSTISLGTVTVANGGTGITSYTIGDLLYANGASSLAALADVATGNVLRSGGVGVAPAWGKVDLTTDLTGTLPVTNGGTGTATAFTQGSVVFAGASGTYTQSNTKFFWNNVDNRLGLNTASPTTVLTIVAPTQTALPPGALPAGTDFHIVGADSAETRITQDAFGTGNYPAFTGRHSRGTAASPTATQLGDSLSQFTGRGYGASAYNSASTGIMEFLAAENFTNSAQGTYASFRLTATGAVSPAEVFRIGPVGQIGVGGSSFGTANQILTSAGVNAAPTWQSGINVTTIDASSTVNFAGLTASKVVFTDASKNLTSTGTVGVDQGGTGITSGTSGGIPYFSGTTTIASSAALAANALVIGGGAGVAPSTTTTGTGVLTALGIAVGSSGAFVTNNTTNTFTAAQTFQAANAVRSEAAATQDAVVLAGRAGGTNSYAVTLVPTTLGGNRTLTLPDASGTILQSGTAVTVAQGGTGLTSATAYAVLCGGTTSTGAFQSISSVGTSGQVLTSNGAGALPTFQTPAGLPSMNIVTGTTQTAVSGNQYVLTNAAATTVTLPSSPSAGATVYITVANGLTTNVVARNGQNIQSLAEDMTLNAAYAAVQLRFADSTRGWVLT